MQPVKGDVNGFKLNHHPLDFFTNKLSDKSGTVIKEKAKPTTPCIKLPKDTIMSINKKLL